MQFANFSKLSQRNQKCTKREACLEVGSHRRNHLTYAAVGRLKSLSSGVSKALEDVGDKEYDVVQLVWGSSIHRRRTVP